jgi:hypothetical protein
MELNDIEKNNIDTEVIFSSYPGLISSTDDYYVTNNKLFVSETTLEIIDVNLYDYVKPADSYIPNFMRVNSATYFSKTAEDWIKKFSFFNSGTYNSQWMVLDFKVFEQNKKEKNISKLLYVLEQTPNLMVSYDMTDYLLEVKIILYI